MFGSRSSSGSSSNRSDRTSVDVNDVPRTLPVLTLPPGQVLLPSSAISIQVYAEHNVNLLKTCLADVKAENKPAYIAVAPLRASAAAPSPSEKALALAGDSGGGGDSVNQRTHGDEAALQIIRMPSDTEEPEPGNKHVRAKRPTTKQISDWVCAARIVRIERLSKTIVPAGEDGNGKKSDSSTTQNGYILVLEGICRAHIDKYTQPGTPYFEAAVTLHPRVPENMDEDVVKRLGEVAAQLIEMLATAAGSSQNSSPLQRLQPVPKLPSAALPNLPVLALKRLRSHLSGLSATTADELSDILLATLLPSTRAGSYAAKLHHLTLLKAEERVRHANIHLEVLRAEMESRNDVGQRYVGNVQRKAREMVLRGLMEAIWQELRALKRQENDENGNGQNGADGSPAPLRVVRNGSGGRPGTPRGPGSGRGDGTEEEEEEEDEMAVLARKIEDCEMAPEALTLCRRELKRLQNVPQQSPEHSSIRNYLDWMVSLPWTRSSYDDPDARQIDRSFLDRARQQLDDDHFGLESVKERLLQYLAVLRLRAEAHVQEQERKAIEAPAEAEASASQVKERALVKRKKGQNSHTDPDIGPVVIPVTGEESGSDVPRPVHRKKHHLAGLKDKGPILLLVGPPGVGKTSIARSLATALGRPYHRISLGGVRDEAEIRGHRRTYVASMPGVFIQSLRKVGVNNPLILLDEIDKISGGSGVHGDPAAAMLEVLDPEQNFSFGDHYLGTPIDLSSVLFIATANSLDTIPPALLDRMEVIRLGGYVDTEKLQIARRHLLPKVIKANVLQPHHVSIDDETILQIVNRYCGGESGVRTLERQLGTVCRWKAVELARARDKMLAGGEEANQTSTLVAAKGRSFPVEEEKICGYNPLVAVADLETILGTQYYEPELAGDADDVRPGVATGLAYMGSGAGGIMFIEAAQYPGNGQLVLTGSLGDVISESARLAFSWVRAHAYDLGLTSSRTVDIAHGLDVHLHCPAGSISKNGPSAGGVMVLCMVSLFSGHALDSTLAMTGEMTLRGKITAIGGVKEKCLGAYRAGIKRLILPERNRKDYIADVPEVIKNAMSVTFVDNIWQALEAAFGDKVGTSPGIYEAPLAAGNADGQAGKPQRHLVNGISRL